MVGLPPPNGVHCPPGVVVVDYMKSPISASTRVTTIIRRNRKLGRDGGQIIRFKLHDTVVEMIGFEVEVATHLGMRWVRPSPK